MGEICLGVIVIAVVAGIYLRTVVGPFSTIHARAYAAYWRQNPQYAKALHQIARRSNYRDQFGDMEEAEWRKAFRNFLSEKAPELCGGKKPKNLRNSFLAEVEASLRQEWTHLGLPDPTQQVAYIPRPDSEAPKLLKAAAVEFEHRCADVLRTCGWETEHTGRAGDQGADLIARKNGLTTVVQCKNYSGSVGNGAVQEVVAARGFYDAHAAIVVTDYGRFTKSSRQLAHKLGVTLLTLRELPEHLKARG